MIEQFLKQHPKAVYIIIGLFFILTFGALAIAKFSQNNQAYVTSPHAEISTMVPEKNNLFVYAQPLVLGAQINAYEISTACKFIPELGVKATTIWVDWGTFEPKLGTYKFGKIDKELDQLASCGIKDFGLHIMLKNKWGTLEKNTESPPRVPSQFNDALTVLVKHFKNSNLPGGAKVTRYAIGNEYESANHWPGTVADYTRLLPETYQSIKNANPQALAEESGTGGSCFGFAIANLLLQQGRSQEAINYINSYYSVRPAISYKGTISSVNQLKTVLGQADTTNKFACRFSSWFPDLYGVNRGYDASQIHYYAPWNDLSSVFTFVRDGLETNGKPADFPIEVWEIGYGWKTRTTYNEQNHAETVVKLLATAAGEGADRVVYWKLLDELFKHQGAGGTSPSKDVGLILDDKNGTYHIGAPAIAYKTTTRMLEGAISAGPLNVGNASVITYKFNFGDGHEVFVAWTDNTTPTATVHMPVSGSMASVTDINGKTSSVSKDAIKVTQSPVFVK